MSTGRTSINRLAVQRLLRRLGTILVVVGFVLLILHTVGGKHLVDSIYDGALTPALGHFFRGRSVTDIHLYYAEADRRVAYLLAAITALTVALLCIPISSQRWPFAIFTIDVLFMAVDRSFGVVNAAPLQFSVSTDRGYPEVFQYLKEAGISVGFFFLHKRCHDGIYLVWSSLFAYLLADDALMIHETLGFKLSRYFQFPSILGLRSEDLGELLVVSSVGTLVLASLAITYSRASVLGKRVTWALLALVGILALFGVAADLLAIAVESEWLEFIENAGEMIAMSVIVGYLYRVLENTRVTPRRSGTP